MTDLCNHEQKSESGQWLCCEHCEYGCQDCGKLTDDQNDDGYCVECQESRQQYAADMIYESMKYGD